MTVSEAKHPAQSTHLGGASEPWRSIEVGASHAGVSPETMREWIRRGFVPAARVGRVWRVRLSEIDQFLIQGGGASNATAARARAVANSFATAGGANG